MKAFKMSNMKEYHGLYLKIHVLLFGCVFETFRSESMSSLNFFVICFCIWNESMNSFELDPAHYLSTPGRSWDAMLRLSSVNSKLILNIEKYQFIESTIRAISIICKGYAEANNIFLKSYDANKPTSYIIYLDANNLYGHSIMQLLPTEIFNLVNPKDFNLGYYSFDNPIGCFLEADFRKHISNVIQKWKEKQKK